MTASISVWLKDTDRSMKPKAITLLKSRLAKKIFFLFIICSLLPLIGMSHLTLKEVSERLMMQAREKLRLSAKNTGMSIVERLQLVQDDLKHIAEHLRQNPKNIESAVADLRKKYRDRFDDIRLVTPGKALESDSSFSQTELDHLTSGAALLRVTNRKNGKRSIDMIYTPDPGRINDFLITAAISGDYIWDKSNVTPDNEIFILDENGDAIFSTLDERDADNLRAAIVRGNSSGSFRWLSHGEEHIAESWLAFMRPQFYSNWIIVATRSSNEILMPLRNFRRIFILNLLLTLSVVIFISHRIISRNLLPINTIIDAIARIKAKDYDVHVDIRSRDEFRDLGDAFNDMAATIGKQMKDLETINNVGIALTTEQDASSLLDIVLSASKQLITADGAMFYSADEDGFIRLSKAHFDSIGMSINEDTDTRFNYRKGRACLLASYAISAGRTFAIENVHSERELDLWENIEFDRLTGYRTISAICVPLTGPDRKVMGAIQLTNAVDPASGEIIPFGKSDISIAETLASQAAIFLANRKSREDFRRLFDSLVEMIAEMIDTRTSYAGKHCRRVPALAMMIAEAVNRQDHGVFADVFFDDSRMYTIRTAAMLHDCGKIVVPEHIELKSSKLETVFDKIGLVDAYVEIIKRDILLNAMNSGAALTTVKADQDNRDITPLHDAIRQLEEDRVFLHECNTGRKRLSEHDIGRLRAIAGKYRWRDSSGKGIGLLTADMLKNLSIPVGTINSDERKIIASHASATSTFLRRLHYPEVLKDVPGIAEVHHERINGHGYPRGLRGEEIPIEGRIIAIADVFEALTAQDRPYKDGFSLDQAVETLKKMADEGHIDRDLYNLVIEEKIHEEYAAKFLYEKSGDERVRS
jgi:HD-GYP domain-containing protein (c-di-GMP phosphodiesterase class II)